MNRNVDFAYTVDEQFSLSKNVLLNKNKEYATTDDVFENFNIAGRIDDVTPEQALWGMYLKHLVSVRKIVKDLDNNILPSMELLNEKFTDSINYHLLLKGMLIERIENNEK